MHPIVRSFLLFSPPFPKLFDTQGSNHDKYYLWTFGGESRWKSFLLFPLVFLFDARNGLKPKFFADNILCLDKVDHAIPGLIVYNDRVVLIHGEVELLRVDPHILQHVLVLVAPQPPTVPLVLHRAGQGATGGGDGHRDHPRL